MTPTTTLDSATIRSPLHPEALRLCDLVPGLRVQVYRAGQPKLFHQAIIVGKPFAILGFWMVDVKTGILDQTLPRRWTLNSIGVVPYRPTNVSVEWSLQHTLALPPEKESSIKRWRQIFGPHSSNDVADVEATGRNPFHLKALTIKDLKSGGRIQVFKKDKPATGPVTITAKPHKFGPHWMIYVRVGEGDYTATTPWFLDNIGIIPQRNVNGKFQWRPDYYVLAVND